MDFDSETKLKSLFAQSRAKKEAALSKEEKQKRDRELDLENFAIWQADVIKPALEKVAIFVRDEGWDAKVISEPGIETNPNLPPQPAIGIYFSDNGPVSGYEPEKHASVIFRCVTGTSKISVRENSIMPGRGGISGTGVSYPFNQVDAGFVSKKATNLLMRLLDGQS